MPHICKQGFSFCVITVFCFLWCRFFLCMCSNLLFNGFLWGHSDKKRPSFQAGVDARKEYFLCFIGNKALGLAVYLLTRFIDVVTFPFHPRMHFVTAFTAFPLTCRRHIMFCMQDLSGDAFHHTSTVVLLLLRSVLSATIPTIEFEKKCSRSRQPVSRLPGLPSHPASQAAVCPAKHAGKLKLRWRQMLWMTDSPGKTK